MIRTVRKEIIRQIGIEWLFIGYDVNTLSHLSFFFVFFVNFFRDFIWLFPSFIFVSRVPCGAAQSSVDVSCKKIDRSIRHKYPYVEQGERCFESSNRLNIRSPASNLFKSVKTCNTVFSLKLSKRNARITE